MSMVEIECHNKTCRRKKMVRRADIARGWGKFCSKRCKAVEQTRRTGRGKPNHCMCEVDEADMPYGMDYLSECGDR